MSYQVLARKWRPKTFQEMVGQEHVLKALVNALDDDRLHHAYLFTGTRGVGKTSIARLFAKSLNCEQGVSSRPCGQCSACTEIAEGRFVDLIEVDAASRTKVEDTRDLLENVQYAPTHGRYKVYLIDEVHMLSTHSFNALLKTLEEPPPHVKFLLATTDPQKLPVTILSRCLQFNLKNMIPERIVDHLKTVLGAEQIPFEEPALWLLARSADGSMRDAMSLTDQAIAFGAGQVNEADARAMLGTIDQRLVYRMLEQLADGDCRALLETVTELAQFSPDYDTVLADLISLLHRIAIAQAVPEAVDNSLGDKAQVEALAGRLSAEDVQLYYQVALMGRKDLPYVADAREGLEMVLLRMAAFRPAGAAPRVDMGERTGTAAQQPAAAPNPAATQSATQATAPAQPSGVEPVANQQRATPVPQSTPQPAAVQSAQQPPLHQERQQAPQQTPQPVAAPQPLAQPAPVSAPTASDDPPPWDDYDLPPAGSYEDAAPVKKPEAPPRAAPVAAPEAVAVAVEPAVATAPSAPTAEPMAAVAVNSDKVLAPDQADEEVSLDQLQPAHWVTLVHRIGVSGMTDSLARTLSLEAVAGNQLRFHYTEAQEALLSEVQRERISTALSNYFASQLQVDFEKGEQTRETPAEYQERKRQERLARAVSDIQNDATVQAIIAQFNGRIELDTVVPIDEPA
ncbi:DNA polymerase III subunit gamma/tau [Marinobacterium arenosum]|uniref:DNA polymerase III subunit gamma/tau n=1 Tax=Marinobacterium arenosum TaxID=2862496 RepID=UPI001C964CE7|nr:DNA polymerase III subunit gamma/tau [Marinobacterium arenosum]MBY4677597.1 DNA polymerase III subunit gamma/tau [Marinobacterium arenosum]